ncbi:MAG: hypothetical protein US96_C0011G0024 [Candidatus Woesebacteria bacterium GW2011_GWB1_38_5b]|uniref:SCP domain-containing protein n=1 Tax=Candidatus Woesebacteria bacterium GW2011_GWB1_38_5b TaxID=1618569 RepID=A0A0G0NE84_9BACT|nr:MAG: hypothetical protein US96_C0011G0024 [Candidatus Woesebacteria bacterium GW2011_GWB1_38_5b]OGH47352.1 MAG: hypothetical protein A3A51_01105 [Candidatus Levybacteria bacterium RIFCSPLOWO2_01_FULL_39_10]
MKNKRSKFPTFIYSSKILPIFLVFLVIFLFSASSPNLKNNLKDGINKSGDTETENETSYVEPTPFLWTVEKVDGQITQIALPQDSKMSTEDELFDAMNVYRSTHGVNQLQKNDLLCSIAQNRAAEQVANDGFDSHAGFGKYASNQNEFSKMGEVLFGGAQPQYGVHIVEYGWDRSLTGHRETIRNPDWQFGCAGIADFFAVFVFATP